MLLDTRFLGANSTASSRNAWAEDQLFGIHVIWSFMILLHFAALVQLNPVLVHYLSVVLRRVEDEGGARVGFRVKRAGGEKERAERSRAHYERATTSTWKSDHGTDRMSTYLSNLLTTTTSRYNNLRRTLLSNEDDGDTEDDSHISRVLRAYYTENQRAFPPWLPPDPNERQREQQTRVQQQPGQYGGVVQQGGVAGGRSQYLQAQHQQGSRSSLSDLWDPPAPAPSQQPQQPLQPQSLRAGRRPAAQGAQSSLSTLAPPSARPLPSQRAGSYQTMQQQAPSHLTRPGLEPSPPSSSGGAGTAQERLKARLWGAGRGGSSGSVSTLGSQSGEQAGGGGVGGQYDGGGSGRGRFGRMG
ncbi:hypothetical protein LTR08_009184 [Meristemomyces frigidus]|nr:hypothetical protein LTR08_009184 [Meristemomyces frigidus]